MSRRLEKLGRVMSKRLTPGGRKLKLQTPASTAGELRQRRKASVGSATQSTRLSTLTDDMLLDQTQVLVTAYPVFILFMLGMYQISSCIRFRQDIWPLFTIRFRFKKPDNETG